MSDKKEIKRRPLTHKQKKFADLYLKTSNATQSYIDAGYSVTKRNVAEVNAHRLLKNHKIHEYIQQRVEEKSRDLIASQDEVLEYLTRVLRGKETERLAFSGMHGIDLIDNTPSLKDRTRAAELLAKRYGLLKENVEHSGSVQVVDDID